MTKRVQILTTFLLLITAATSVQAQGSRQQPRFINDIEFTLSDNNKSAVVTTASTTSSNPKSSITSAAIEAASKLQFKYAILLDIEVEMATNLSLFGFLDQWMGTPYRLGGTTKKGIDCSAFMQILYTSMFGVTIPRTCREQYQAAEKIKLSDLHEGDLIFFNTRGGVSHVGMYLQNNKFVHASSSEGVTITDLDDPYWSRRIIGARRLEGATAMK
jgi:murein DD-endopeptidase / murein LD-carboxypeptidase